MKKIYQDLVNEGNKNVPLFAKYVQQYKYLVIWEPGNLAWLLHGFSLAYELSFCLEIGRMKKYFLDLIDEDNKNVD